MNTTWLAWVGLELAPVKTLRNQGISSELDHSLPFPQRNNLHSLQFLDFQKKGSAQKQSECQSR